MAREVPCWMGAHPAGRASALRAGDYCVGQVLALALLAVGTLILLLDGVALKWGVMPLDKQYQEYL